MKKTLPVLFLSSFLVLGLVFTQLVYAAETATVTATVTAQEVSVTVSDGSIDYGVLASSGSKTTLSGGADDQQTATNAGNVPEDFNIKGQDSGDWTLGSAIDANVYAHKFCISSCGTNGSPANFTALTTSYQTLASSVAVSGNQVFDLQLIAPSSSTVYTSQSVDVIVQAVAS